MKIITDKNKVNEVLARGVENIYPNREALEKVLMSGKRIRLYCGYDPSSPALHIGNAISLAKLGQFQDLGHEIIFLIGDFTGMIGDPTDKLAARKRLTRAQVLANSKNYKKQASAYLKFNGRNAAKVLYNSQWSDRLTFKDLIELASNFTAQQIMQRDMFQERIKQDKPIYLHEFLYPLAQGYDSVAMDVDMEIGGNDQTFNMLVGRDLMRAIKNKEKFVLATKLLTDPSGKKMGKTEGNMITLTDSAENMFGKVMSWPDTLMPLGFEVCTEFDFNSKANPRDEKMRLAYEVVKVYRGKEEAEKARENFLKLFSKKEIPDDIKEVKINVKETLGDILVANKIVPSNSEFRRLVKSRAIDVDGRVIDDIKFVVEKSTVVKIGKKKFLKILV